VFVNNVSSIIAFYYWEAILSNPRDKLLSFADHLMFTLAINAWCLCRASKGDWRVTTRLFAKLLSENNFIKPVIIPERLTKMLGKSAFFYCIIL